jgi:hypothetical protein
MRSLVSLTMTGALAAPALAAEMTVSVEIPRLNVAEYHRPYVAIWLEKPDQSFIGNLAVWEHRISVALDQAPMKGLAAGEYHLVIEAAREVGGRELLRIPFRWPATAPQNLNVKGEHELGLVAIGLRP